ncbi:MAG TPA: hypothetical protein VE631_07215 [Alphaproteobacteria bacterium]|nr:hypothetical protein [Alphaproteobacteria bacterium]
MFIDSVFNQARSLFRPPGVDSARAVEPDKDSDDNRDSHTEASHKAQPRHDDDGPRRSDAGPHTGRNLDISV